MRRLLSPARLGVLGLVVLTALAVLYLAPSDDYIFLPDRARPLAPQVKVQGERAEKDDGGIYYVAVDVKQASLLESFFPSVYEGSTLVPEERVNPPGVSESVRREAELDAMQRSQRIAAAVALRSAGYRVRVRSVGVLITAVFPDAPATGRLHPSDVVVAVDGRPVHTPAGLAQAIRRHQPGQIVRLRVRRDGSTREFALRTVEGGDPPRPVVGIGIEQAADIRLPVRVQIDLGNVGGPSAGLAFALDILEELGRNIDRGQKVAATGELLLDGSVQDVGGIKQKTIGARRAGVDVFLVPAAGDNLAVARKHAHGVRIVAVSSFRQALRSLATLEPES